MLDLKNTTLLFVETRAHEITKRVIDDCISRVNFGDILLFTDKPDFAGRGFRYIDVPDFPNKKEAGQFYYGKAMEKVNTDFALMLEWDAGIFDETKWLPEFFNYDYIGAPWKTSPNEHNRLDVGNGGFTLMSAKLGQFVAANQRNFPVTTDWDFCRVQRPHLERWGFKWPGRDLAGKFSWELCPRDPDHFGFHGAFTWPEVLSKDEIMVRARLMLKTDYLIVKMRDLVRTAPWVLTEFTPEELARFHNIVPPGQMLRPRIPGIMSAQQRAMMQLMQAQRRGFISANQRPKGLKA